MPISSAPPLERPATPPGVTALAHVIGVNGDTVTIEAETGHMVKNEVAFVLAGRERVARLFDVRRMVRDYESHYVDAQSPAAARPQAPFPAEAAL